METVRRVMDSVLGARHSPAPPPAEPGPAVAPAAPAVTVRPPRDRGPFAVLLIAVIAVLWISRAVLGPFIVSAVLAYAFSPLVTAGQRRTGRSRVTVVAIGYVIALGVLITLFALLAEKLVAEARLLAEGGPDAFAKTLESLLGTAEIRIGTTVIPTSDIAREIQDRVIGLIATPGDALHVAGQIGEAGLQAILAVIVTFYFLVDGDAMMDRIVGLLPIEHQARTVDVLGRIHVILGKWLRGQLLLIALVSAVAYIGLGPVLHLPYALVLALLTGVLEIIPLVGPLVATAIVAIDAFARDGLGLAAVVIAFYFVLRQVEDQIVAPVVIGRAVHLHPVVTIFAVLVGLSVYGILGGLLGVPFAAAVNVVFRELYPERPPVVPPPAPPSGEAAPTEARTPA